MLWDQGFIAKKIPCKRPKFRVSVGFWECNGIPRDLSSVYGIVTYKVGTRWAPPGRTMAMNLINGLIESMAMVINPMAKYQHRKSLHNETENKSNPSDKSRQNKVTLFFCPKRHVNPVTPRDFISNNYTNLKETTHQIVIKTSTLGLHHLWLARSSPSNLWWNSKGPIRRDRPFPTDFFERRSLVSDFPSTQRIFHQLNGFPINSTDLSGVRYIYIGARDYITGNIDSWYTRVVDLALNQAANHGFIHLWRLVSEHGIRGQILQPC